MTGPAGRPAQLDSFDAIRELPGHPGTYFVSLDAAQRGGAGTLDALPYSLRVLAENLLRHEDGRMVTAGHIRALTEGRHDASIPFTPGRILLQDASGIPVIADLVTLRERALALGLDPASVSPRLPMDLVVDHAVELDESGTATALAANLDLEYTRHTDRYRFLRWAQNRIPELRVIPPGVGICHQLNLEVLAEVVATRTDGDRRVAGFDTLVGTDSHTTMINALSVLGWGVGGIEATAAALGQPILLPVPEVVGIRLSGRTGPGVLATDIALRLAALLRSHGVVQKIVEFHGPGLATLSVPDRATVANMAPEYGATMAYFPADHRTLSYLDESGRPSDLVRSYLVAQGMLYSDRAGDPEYAEIIEFDLSRVGRTMAGPARPHQAVAPGDLPPDPAGHTELDDGAIVIASITSCTNTSNPRAMVAAGLLARNAVRRGIRIPWWVKTSLTPGSRSAADLLADSGLQAPLDELGFQVAGFGCGTCMGNSGPLPDAVSDHLRTNGTQAVAVLSGNRNFPGRIHPDVTQTYLASPPMVVAAALAGRLGIELGSGALCTDAAGDPVTLADLWPSDDEIDSVVARFGRQALRRASVTSMATDRWLGMEYPVGEQYPWDGETGSIRRPPFTEPEITVPMVTGDIRAARPLLVLGDGVTTDHISPVARITADSASGRWLAERGVRPADFGSYSSRRLNHEVMLRGGFANPRLENWLVPELTGGWTRVAADDIVSPDPVRVHIAAAEYRDRGVPAVVVAGHSYGAGSARDWAAKVTRMLGIRAVIARSFERIHRTNLVAVGVLPIECADLDPADIELRDEIDIVGLARGIDLGGEVSVVVRRDGAVRSHRGRIRVDTAIEVGWIERGGVIPHLLDVAGRQMLA
ncbi:aconitate hydratase AcnA [Nocardia grenadensis]